MSELQPPAPNDTLLIGVVIAAVGLKGQIKLRAITNDIGQLKRSVKVIFIGPKRTPYPLTHVNYPKPHTLVLTLGSVTTREAAEELRRQEVYILETDAAPLATDEYFIHDLYGMTVVDEAGETIGKVKEVIETGANDVLVVTRSGKPETLIPMIHDVVQRLDVPGKQIIIRPLPGLIE